MSGYSMPTGEDDPVHVVRMVGRLAQMVLELRDEYVETRREDTLEQLDRRLVELNGLHARLRAVKTANETRPSG